MCTGCLKLESEFILKFLDYETDKHFCCECQRERLSQNMKLYVTQQQLEENSGDLVLPQRFTFLTQPSLLHYWNSLFLLFVCVFVVASFYFVMFVFLNERNI